jgi:hypothetical protein
MRDRTTWNHAQIIKLANSLKKADDPRAMNQDHLKQQPAADKYEIGGPSEFAEDVHPSTNSWKAEYSGGEVRRNEIGLPELRSDTFNHPEKTASQDEEEDDDFLEKKADVCLSIAKRMLPKTASEQMIEDQAFAFMHLADADIIATHARLASQDEEDDKKQQDKAQQQDKEAGQIPENFKKKDDEGQQDKKEAGQVPENFKKDEDKKDEDKGQQSKEAQGQQGDDKKQQSQGQQDDDKKQASDRIAALQKKACDALMSGDQQAAQQAVQQIAQLQQQAQQQPMMSQEQAQQQVQQMLSQALQGQPQQDQQMGDDQMLDQMLQQQVQASTDTSMLTTATGPMMDIQLEGSSMDMTEVRLGSEDEALATLFASHDEVQQAAFAQSLQTGIPVQASAPMTRTASTRTVGTRPTGGVSQLGGASAPSSGGGEIDKLSNLWASAPNVKSVFDT